MTDQNIAIKISANGASAAAAGIGRLSEGVKRLGSASMAAAKTGVKALAIGVAGLSAAAAAGTYALSRGVRASLDYGSQIHKLANTLGVGADEVAVLSQAFRENGLEAGMVASMLPKMQRKIAESSDAFAKLGLSAESLRGKSVTDQFEAIGSAIRGITSQEDKMLALMKIFEEAGPQMMQLFNSPDAFKGARETLGSEAALLGKNAAAMERASTLLSNVSVKLRGFFSGVAVGVLDPLLRALESFNRLDFAAVGARFGEAIGQPLRAALQAFKEGRLGDLLASEFSWAVSKLSDMVSAAFSEAGIGRALVNVFVAAGEAAGKSFLHAVSPKILSDIGEAKEWIANWSFNEGSRVYKNKGMTSQKELASAFSSLGKALGNIPSAAASTLSAESPATVKLRAERDALRADLVSRAPGMLEKFSAGTAGGSPSPQQQTAPESASTAKTNADSLARIGGFLGGTNSPATSAAKRTAKNTDKMVSSLDRIAREIPRIASSGGTAAAVYAA